MDGALEYSSHAAQAYYKQEKIHHSISPPYTPNTTRIESLWRTLDRIARASMADAGLPEGYWPYAFHYATDVRNAMMRDGGKSGHENLTGRPARISTFRPLGCRAYVRKSDREVRAAGSAALGPRGWLGVNLGLARGGGPGYWVYVPELREVKYTSDVDFDVQVFPWRPAGTRGCDLPPTWWHADAPAPGRSGGGGGR